LDLIDEHAEVLAGPDQRSMLVVHLHAQTVRGLTLATASRASGGVALSMTRTRL
jgi:hypothetical protein